MREGQENLCIFANSINLQEGKKKKRNKSKKPNPGSHDNTVDLSFDAKDDYD